MTRGLEAIAVRALYVEMHRIKPQVPTSLWFVFGSIMAAKRPIGDIDLLVVCDTTADCRLVRHELDLICVQYPIHLLRMTTGEERELNFIQGEGAVEITRGNTAQILGANKTEPRARLAGDRVCQTGLPSRGS